MYIFHRFIYIESNTLFMSKRANSNDRKKNYLPNDSVVKTQIEIPAFGELVLIIHKIGLSQ